MNQEILNIIEAALNYDIHGVIKYARILQEKSKNNGTNLSKRIERLLNRKPIKSNIVLDSRIPLHILLEEMLIKREKL